MTPAEIGLLMIDAGVDVKIVRRLIELARESEGASDLLTLWAEHPEERDEALAELWSMVEDREPTGAPWAVRSTGDAELEIERRRAFKARLRATIDRHGGVSRVAERAGIPQPSLSRLLNSLSEPRPATLERLAEAMDLSVAALLGAPVEAQIRTLARGAFGRQLDGLRRAA